MVTYFFKQYCTCRLTKNICFRDTSYNLKLCTGLLVGREKKVRIRWIFRDKFAGKKADFAGIFEANFAEKRSVKKQAIL